MDGEVAAEVFDGGGGGGLGEEVFDGALGDDVAAVGAGAGADVDEVVGGADAVFVRATVCDADGNLVPDATNSVGFSISGEANFISPSTVRAEAGMATVLIRSSGRSPGRVLMQVTAPGLMPAQLELNSK